MLYLMCVYIYIYIGMCVCKHLSLSIYIYIYICVFLCVYIYIYTRTPCSRDGGPHCLYTHHDNTNNDIITNDSSTSNKHIM